jgi:site-specific recombinase XerD
MTTIKLAVLRHTQAKDGTYKIRIAIGHKSETHYIVTRYRVKSLANFSQGIVTGQPDAKAINIKLRQLLNDYDERLERIPNAGELSCEQLRNILRDMQPKGSNTTLMQVHDIYTRNLIQENRKTTANLITYHIQRFVTFTHGDIMLSNITARLIDEYLHHLRTQHLSPSYINMSIAPIRTLVNYAVKMQYVRYDINPFAYYHQQDSQPRDLDISVEDMRKLFAFRPAMRKTRKTLDIFLLSYLLGGMNFADLISYDFSNRTEISYIRQKTKLRNTRPTVFSIPPEALPIIDRLADKKTGRIALGYTGDYHSMLACVNNSLKTIARQAGLTCKRVSFYSARKSFIQHGFDIGTPLEILEYCSGQTMKSNRPIFNYVKIMRRHADVAIRNVIDNIINPPTSSQTQEGKTNDI